MALADQLCDGRLVVVHEGGYAESAVPFCAHATVEAMCGVRTAVEDPYLELGQAMQVNARQAAFQRSLLDEMALSMGY
jgi:acetoin utilization deacetylase AcuC-like enzyme